MHKILKLKLLMNNKCLVWSEVLFIQTQQNNDDWLVHQSSIKKAIFKVYPNT